MSRTLQKSVETSNPADLLRKAAGKSVHYKMAAGEISREGITLIQQLLSEHDMPAPEADAVYGNDGIDWCWLTKRGTLPKRIAGWLAKHNQKADPKLLSLIGNLARQHSSDEEDYYFRIIRGPFTFGPKQFGWGSLQHGTSQSCWWKGGDLDGFSVAGGYAALFYSGDTYYDDYGIGRAWVWPDHNKELLIVFNGYWKREGATLKIARILASYFGLNYRQITASSDDQDGIYVNTNKDDAPRSNACVLGSREVTSEIKSYFIPVEKGDSLGAEYECYACGCDVDEDSDYRDYDDDHYCADCFYERYFYCDRCGETDHQSNRTDVDGDSWCEDCTNSYAHHCSYCGEYSKKETATVINRYHTEREWCLDCADNHAAQCERCDQRYENADFKNVEGESWCDTCVDSDANQCFECDSYVTEWSEVTVYKTILNGAVVSIKLVATEPLFEGAIVKQETKIICGDCKESEESDVRFENNEVNLHAAV